MSRRIATIAARAGVDNDAAHGAVMPPLYLSSNYSFAGFAQKRLADTECLGLLLFGIYDKGTLKTGAGVLAMCQAGGDQPARAGLRRDDRRVALAKALHDAFGLSCQAFIYTTLLCHVADYTRPSPRT